jgi:hypothetical protein
LVLKISILSMYHFIPRCPRGSALHRLAKQPITKLSRFRVHQPVPERFGSRVSSTPIQIPIGPLTFHHVLSDCCNRQKKSTASLQLRGCRESNTSLANQASEDQTACKINERRMGSHNNCVMIHFCKLTAESEMLQEE